MSEPEHQTHPPLSLETVDSVGLKASDYQDLLGAYLQHQVKLTYYCVYKFFWNAVDEEWGLLLYDATSSYDDAIPIGRSLDNVLGNVAPKKPRYKRFNLVGGQQIPMRLLTDKFIPPVYETQATRTLPPSRPPGIDIMQETFHTSLDQVIKDNPSIPEKGVAPKLVATERDVLAWLLEKCPKIGYKTLSEFIQEYFESDTNTQLPQELADIMQTVFPNTLDQNSDKEQ